MNLKSNKCLNWFEGLGLIPKILFIFTLCCIFIAIIIVLWYINAISSKVNDKSNITVNIDIGSSTSKIAEVLEQSDVINSSLAFKIYVKLNNISELQAGVYSLNRSMDLKEIIDELKNGIVYDKKAFNITFIEGKNINWIAQKIASDTNNSTEDVFNLLNDTNYINSLINNYWFLTEDITNSNIYYALEGYLFPDTYNISSKDIDIKDIFKLMLDRMDAILSPYKKDIEKSNYSIHDILTLASIIEVEGINDTDRKNISSVLYNRLNSDMSLGSDVTAYYAFKIDIGTRDLTQNELNTYNPYNTRGPKMNGKLPIGPICLSSRASIEAAIYPNDTNYLYFVADKNGKVFFTKSLSEHSEKIQELKKAGNWLEYN